MNAAIYVRVSTQEQADRGFSIGEQLERLRAYLTANGWNSAGEFVDAGYSGANMNRPGLLSLLDDIGRGRIQKVVVWKLDRLSRSQKDTLALIEDRFLSAGVEFESMSERFDTATPFGRAMVGILAVFAQLEREQIRERMTMGMDAVIKMGRPGSGRAPWGYIRKDKNFIIDDAAAPIIREIFERYAAGVSVRQICLDLVNRGVPSAQGKTIYKSVVLMTLQNPTYTGKILWRGEVYDGTHAPIISQELFDAVQNRLAEERAMTAARGCLTTRNDANSLLSGLIWCGRCGARYCVQTALRGGRSRSAPGARMIKLYECYSRCKRDPGMIVDPTCKNDNWHVEDLNAVVVDQVSRLAVDPDFLESVRKADDDAGARSARMAAIRAELKRIENALSRLVDLYTDGAVDRRTLDKKATALQDRRQILTAEMMNLQRSAPPAADDIRKNAVSFSAAMDVGTLAEQRELLGALIERITLDGPTVSIKWRF